MTDLERSVVDNHHTQFDTFTSDRIHHATEVIRLPPARRSRGVTSAERPSTLYVNMRCNTTKVLQPKTSDCRPKMTKSQKICAQSIHSCSAYELRYARRSSPPSKRPRGALHGVMLMQWLTDQPSMHRLLMIISINTGVSSSSSISLRLNTTPRICHRPPETPKKSS